MTQYGQVNKPLSLLSEDATVGIGATVEPTTTRKSLEIFRAKYICIKVKGKGASGSTGKLTFSFALKCGDDDGSEEDRIMTYPTVPTESKEVNCAVGDFSACFSLNVEGYSHIRLDKIVSTSAAATTEVNAYVNWKD